MANNIVTVNVTQQVASAPNLLQGTGALVSLGGTNLSANTTHLLTQLSDLTPLLAASGTSEILAMATTWFAQGSQVPVYVLELGSGAAPSALSTYITANPGIFYAFLTPTEWDALSGIAAPATPTLTSTAGGSLPATTYYVAVTYTNATGETKPSAQASEAVLANNLLVVDSPTTESGTTGYNVYVGTSSGVLTKQNTTPIAIGTNWTEPTSGLISGSIPPTINTTDPFTALLVQYEGLTAQTYFFVTSTLSTYARYTAQMKDVFWLIPSPNASNSEFGCAAAMWKFIGYSPSAINKMTPMAFSYVYSVTPWPASGNATSLASIKSANGNYIAVGTEAGITNNVLYWGTTADGNDASYWYDVDWSVITSHTALAAAVINGSNNPQNPLYYNQAGINQLLAVEKTVANSATAFGIALSFSVTATPFATYVAQNPNNYAAGVYNGIAATVIPQNGFKAITFNVLVSNIPTTA